MSLRILVATTNAGKVKELQHHLSTASCVSLSEISDKIPPNVIEDGQTYYENALKKAIQFHAVYQMPVVSDDSGIEIEALEGAPGIYSARFGGESLSWTDRWQYVYAQLAKKGAKEWSACFRCVLCYYDGRSVPQFFEGTTDGKISPKPLGDQGFGYDPIFFSHDLQKTFGQASADEKKQVSHRARALNSLSSWLDGLPRSS